MKTYGRMLRLVFNYNRIIERYLALKQTWPSAQEAPETPLSSQEVSSLSERCSLSKNTSLAERVQFVSGVHLWPVA